MHARAGSGYLEVWLRAHLHEHGAAAVQRLLALRPNTPVRLGLVRCSPGSSEWQAAQA
jgi:hypothetical protein